MTECTTIAPVSTSVSTPAFPLDQWYVAGFAWELQDAPLARTLLGRPVVLFRTPDGSVAALEDRCCHRELPLSCGTVEARGLRCGYHGLLFDRAGQCLSKPRKTGHCVGFEPRVGTAQLELVIGCSRRPSRDRRTEASP